MSPPVDPSAMAFLRLLQLVLLVVLAGAARDLWRARETVDRRWGLAVGALFAGALAVRWAAPWGPHDVNPRSRAVFEPLMDWGYGLGAPALHRLTLALTPLPWDEPVLFHATAVWGALSCVALVAWQRTWGAPRPVAWLAGALLALQAPHVRLSHSDAQPVPELLLVLLGLTWLGQHARRPSWDRAVLGGLALGAAATFRPEAMAVPGIVLVLVLLAPRSLPWRRRETWVGIALLVVLWAPHVAGMLGRYTASDTTPVAGLIVDGRIHHGLVRVGPRHLYLLDPAWTAPLLPLLMVAAGLARKLPLRSAGALGLAAFVLASLIPDWTWTPLGTKAYSFTRFQLRAAPFAAALAAWGARGVADQLRGRWAMPAMSAVALGAALWTLPVAFDERTSQAEYRFFSRHLGDVPDGCTILTYRYPNDAGLSPHVHLSELRGHDHRWTFLSEWDGEVGACLVWYRPGNCSLFSITERLQTEAGEPTDPERCAAFEAEHDLEPLAETEVPPGSWIVDDYRDEPVRVGFYRVAP